MSCAASCAGCFAVLLGVVESDELVDGMIILAEVGEQSESRSRLRSRSEVGSSLRMRSALDGGSREYDEVGQLV